VGRARFGGGGREAGVKALSVNLATRPFRNNTIIGSTVAAVAIGLLVATIYNLYVFLSYGSSYALLLDDQARNRTKLEVLQVEERSLIQAIEQRDFATAFDRGSIASELIVKRTFSWTELFNKLESLVPPEVMMSAIRPNVTSGTIVIRVEGVAKTHSAFLDLQENLLAHESFSGVYPASIRRLNPSRPEITFILNFDYRQSERTVPAPVPAPVVAAGGSPTAPRGATGPAGSSGVGAASGRAATPAATVVTGTPVNAAAVLRAAVADRLPIGRDGRPRTLEVIARRMIAPGGVYEPPAMKIAAEVAAAEPPVALTPTPRTAAPSTQSPSPTRTSSLTPPPTAVQSTDEAGSQAAAAPAVEEVPPQQFETPSEDPPGPDASPPADPVATGTATAPERTRINRRRMPGPSGREPDPQQSVAGQAPNTAQATAATKRSPVPAGRHDLDFTDRPVREVYRILGQAHGIRFLVDSAIDPSLKVTVNLSGQPLSEAIEAISGLLNHLITQLQTGVYRVVNTNKGSLLVDPPVEEEDLPAPESEP
jgi:hypothetical protein